MKRDATWVTYTDFLCPWCDKRQTDTWEFIGDLRGGDDYTCQHCEKPIEIMQIDYTAHLYIRRASPGGAEGGGR